MISRGGVEVGMACWKGMMLWSAKGHVECEGACEVRLLRLDGHVIGNQ